MKIELKHDTYVRLIAGSVVNVSEAEAKRLSALKLASPIVDEKPAEKPAKAKKK